MSDSTAGLDSTNQAEQQQTTQRQCEEIRGDRISTKTNKIIRISFQNIRGFGITKNSTQSEAIQEFNETNDITIYMMVEVNINWRITGKRNNIWDIARRWFE
jgi:hypothetical protein